MDAMERWPRADEVEFGDKRFNLNSHLLAVACMERGLEPRWIGRALFTVKVGNSHHGFFITDTPATNRVAARLARRKDLSMPLLGSAGLSIAESQTFGTTDIDKAARFAASLGGPVVVKPTDGNKGRDVAVGLLPGDAFRAAFVQATRRGKPAIVERQQLNATEVRVLVVSGRSVAAYLKRPPSVTGDGASTVGELVAAKNRQRQLIPSTQTKLIKITPHRLWRLRKAGLSEDSVLAHGEQLAIDDMSSISSGGDSVDVTDYLHRSYGELSVQAAALTGDLRPAGIDLLVSDLAAPATPKNHIIVEINCTPSIGSHSFPVEGQRRDVAPLLVDEALEAISPRRRWFSWR